MSCLKKPDQEYTDVHFFVVSHSFFDKLTLIAEIVSPFWLGNSLRNYLLRSKAYQLIREKKQFLLWKEQIGNLLQHKNN